MLSMLSACKENATNSTEITSKEKRKELITKFNALDISSGDFEKSYTIDYQKLLADSINFVAISGYVYDIIRLDSNTCKFILIAEYEDNPLSYIAEVVADDSMYINMHTNILRSETSDGLYIIKVADLFKSNNPIMRDGLKCSQGVNADCGEYTFISNDNDYIVLKGVIVDYFIE